MKQFHTTIFFVSIMLFSFFSVGCGVHGPFKEDPNDYTLTYGRATDVVWIFVDTTLKTEDEILGEAGTTADDFIYAFTLTSEPVVSATLDDRTVDGDAVLCNSSNPDRTTLHCAINFGNINFVRNYLCGSGTRREFYLKMTVDYTLNGTPFEGRFKSIKLNAHSMPASIFSANMCPTSSGGAVVPGDGTDPEDGTVAPGTPPASGSPTAPDDPDNDGFVGNDDHCHDDAESFTEDGVTPTDGVADGCPNSNVLPGRGTNTLIIHDVNCSTTGTCPAICTGDACPPEPKTEGDGGGTCSLSTAVAPNAAAIILVCLGLIPLFVWRKRPTKS